MAVERDIQVDASPAEVWEAISTEEGRERWLEDGAAAEEIEVEVSDAPERLVWRWTHDGQPTRVEFTIVPAEGGSWVRVIESAPSVPVSALAASLAAVPA
jgi:uncharacterized protein YndB with AHSA1/START domain